jgi:type VI secretion system protein ImpK
MSQGSQEKSADINQHMPMRMTSGNEISIADTSTVGLVFEPGPNHDERLAMVLQTREQGGNALLEAASVLLRALAEMPQALDAQGVQGLQELLRQELQSFTRLCEQANVRRDHMLAARYTLCTALDESASAKPWGGGDAASTGVWSTQALLNTFHGESQGGKTVFLLIGRLANSPNEHMDVLELMHHVLSLGFMGDYRVQADGHRMIETIRHRLFTMVSGSREPVPRDLSPRWRGVTPGKFQVLHTLPVWLSASVLSLVLFGQFGWYKYQVLTRVSDVEQHAQAVAQWQLASVAPMTSGALGLADVLADEITNGRVQVTEGEGRSTVVFKGDGMFSGGLTQLSATSRSTIEKVAEALNDVPGKVRVVGHTDNEPITKGQDVIPNNQVLSEKRAQAVSQVLTGKGVDPSRIVSVGMGDTVPLASNDTAAGRALNRRVAIEVLSSSELATNTKK